MELNDRSGLEINHFVFSLLNCLFLCGGKSTFTLIYFKFTHRTPKQHHIIGNNRSGLHNVQLMLH